MRSIIVTDKYGQLMVIAQVENHWQRVGTIGEKRDKTSQHRFIKYKKVAHLRKLQSIWRSVESEEVVCSVFRNPLRPTVSSLKMKVIANEDSSPND